MNQKVISAVIFTALIAAAAIYQLQEVPAEAPADSALDTTCGFTDDFANFLKNNGKDSPMQATPAGTSTGLTSSVLPSGEKPPPRKKSTRFL